jgi:uncharacterized membrane protein
MRVPDRTWRLPEREDDEAAAGEEGVGRILALSDGVFAIAITLLILEIAVPATTSDAGLSKALLGLWPRYLSFLPFPTAVLGQHGGSPAAAVLYAISVILAGLASAGYWWYASGRGGLLRPDAGRSQVRALRAAACPDRCSSRCRFPLPHSPLMPPK